MAGTDSAPFTIGDRVWFPANGTDAVDDQGTVLGLSDSAVYVRWDNGTHDQPENAPDGGEWEPFRASDLARVPVHVNYPHHPGWLSGCFACESGPCRCDPATDAPCESDYCQQASDED